MRKQYQPVTSSPCQKHSLRPHPLTQHLSLLHTASLFPVCSILLLLSGKLLKSLVDTASSTTTSIMTAGFHSTFLTGGGLLPPPPEAGGDTPRVWMRVPKTSGPPDPRQVCLSLIGFYLHTVLPCAPSGLPEKPTVLEKRDARDLQLKETVVHL